MLFFRKYKIIFLTLILKKKYLYLTNTEEEILIFLILIEDNKERITEK
ncbi:hypothetical protein Avbf_18661 [Armadillidium vulgare]|nr:hypothetical protein Avbf_18661 [Armadillidium vulgare]